MSSHSESSGPVEQARLFPLPDIVLFPGMRLPLHVFEPRYRRLVEDALSGDRRIAVVRLRPGYEGQYYGCPPIYDVFGVGRVIEYRRLADGRFNILLEGVCRARHIAELRRDPYRVSRAQILQDSAPESVAAASALQSELSSLVKRLLPHLSPPSDALENVLADTSSASRCTDTLAAHLVSDPDARQSLLEQLDPVERMTQLIGRVHDLLTLAGVQRTPSSELN